MPQFDFFSFFVQLFWLILGIFAFYYFCLSEYIAKTGAIEKLRQKTFAITAKANAKIKSTALYEKIVSQWFKRKR